MTKPILKFGKSPTGTKHTVNIKKSLLEPRYSRTILNKSTPKATDWSKSQLKKLRKVANENAKIVKEQKYVLQEYKTGRIDYRPRDIFVNLPLPLAEIKVNNKLGTMIFTANNLGKPKTYRITRADLLQNNYYKEIELFNNILNSEKLVSGETRANLKTLQDVKKRKILEVLKFLKLNNFRTAGITINMLKGHFSLPEIMHYGNYGRTELEKYYTQKEINEASNYLREKRNISKIYSLWKVE